MDLLEADAVTQREALAAGEVSARELLEASVRRADALKRRINAVVARDLDAARAAADQIDANGRTAAGPLAGLPMTVKDTFDVEGLPASAGLPVWLRREVSDAEVVARARRAGAVIWGKTNTPVNSADWQTYNRLYGTTSNPWDTTRTPGGSSGGSAAAVAAGITALEIGADIGGSLRIPAAFCGVAAHKPTWGLVSQRGLVPPIGTMKDMDLAVVGPVARTVRDLRLLLPVIAGAQPWDEARAADPAGLRLGVWLDEPVFALDPEVRRILEGLAERLAGAGCVVERIASPVDADRLMRTYAALLFPLTHGNGPFLERALYEALRGPALLARRLGAGPISSAEAILGATARHRDWLRADDARARMGADLDALFLRYDAVLAPATPVAAFSHDQGPLVARRIAMSDGRRIGHLDLLNWVALATVLGLPATVVPAGLTDGGLPVGVQVIGPRGGDLRTLSVAEAVETVSGGYRRPPI